MLVNLVNNTSCFSCDKEVSNDDSGIEASHEDLNMSGSLSLSTNL